MTQSHGRAIEKKAPESPASELLIRPKESSSLSYRKERSSRHMFQAVDELGL